MAAAPAGERPSTVCRTSRPRRSTRLRLLLGLPVLKRHAIILGTGAAIGAICVARTAWLCDDAFITFRVAQNVIHGWGPRFNVGERVQGFTHPLWFLLLLPGALFGDGITSYAVGLGVIATAALLWLGGRLLVEESGSLATFVAWLALLCTSDAFLSFQTSGLESSLSALLLVLLLRSLRAGGGGMGDVGDVLAPTLASSALLLNRPDHLFLVGPCLVLLLARHGRAAWRPMLAGMLPLAAWELFAVVYYGSPVPNTMYAKLVSPGSPDTLRQGWAYLADYAHFEPVQAAACLALIAVSTVALWRSRADPRSMALLVIQFGLLLHLLYVAAIGGDFMRGRLLHLPLVGTLLVGLAVVGSRCSRRAAWIGAAAILLVAPCAWVVRARHYGEEREILPTGIVNERAYWGPDLARLRERAAWGALGRDLHDYARRNGPVALRWQILGLVGYLAGPEVELLDPFGLTDPVAAHQPPLPGSRVGHVTHQVPEEYYRYRVDISLLAGWQERLRAQDPSLRREAESARRAFAWQDEALRRQVERWDVLARGPLGAAGRWRLVAAESLAPFIHAGRLLAAGAVLVGLFAWLVRRRASPHGRSGCPVDLRADDQ
ncbi:MAG TPA: hypothetical protein VHB47_26660 [Thermoanaerobaculia bacterium]|nr:hypothetical protein [Thermoanaerobaculia bacterium]